jgi:hypothetical protein
MPSLFRRSNRTRQLPEQPLHWQKCGWGHVQSHQRTAQVRLPTRVLKPPTAKGRTTARILTGSNGTRGGALSLYNRDVGQSLHRRHGQSQRCPRRKVGQRVAQSRGFAASGWARSVDRCLARLQAAHSASLNPTRRCVELSWHGPKGNPFAHSQKSPKMLWGQSALGFAQLPNSRPLGH